MTARYQLLYRLGITPWDSGHVPSELAELVTGTDAPAPGRALDIGCGTGTHAVYLAREGWQVTGIDAVEHALELARRRAADADVAVQWLKADVAKLGALDIEPGFTLVYDRGCFHDLGDDAREAYARGVTALAAPDARLLLMAFAPGRRLAAPRGVSDDEIRARFAPSWDVVSIRPDRGPDPPGPMRRVPRVWYRLVRR